MTDFKSLNLAPPLDAALDKLSYTTPTPIQVQAIPDVLKGRDLMGIAQTGTGKTAAFALPLLNHICREERDPPKRGARVLILAPTRELASQIGVSVRDYGCKIEGLSVTVIFGGVPINRQIKKVVSGNDVLVATPGRLIDLVNRGALKLPEVEILVLDEADQMMDMGFIHDLKKIVPLLPKTRQTLFFSATMAPKILALSRQFLTDPVKVSVAPANTTAERVTQSVIFVDKTEKHGLLGLTLLDPAIDRALVFTRTKHGADRVVKRLAQIGIRAIAIHGNKSQGQRQRALQAFREGEVNVLIATDVAARGIDIEGISHVINFEIPNVPEQYVHRIGRTARANRSGIAIAFVEKDERAYLKDIQKLLKTEIPVEPLPENFTGKVKALKKRKALPPPEKPKPDPRRGRGKSRKKKDRLSKNKEDKPEDKSKTAGKENKPNRSHEQKPRKPRKGWKSGDGRKDTERSRVNPSRGDDQKPTDRPDGASKKDHRKKKNKPGGPNRHSPQGAGQESRRAKPPGKPDQDRKPGSGAAPDKPKSKNKNKKKRNPKSTWSQRPDGQRFAKPRGRRSKPKS